MNQNLSLIAAGNEQAFILLYKEYYPKLLQFASAFLKDQQLAEEVTEDVFIYLWCNREQITQIVNLQVYLYVSVKNRCLNKMPVRNEQLSIDVVPEASLPFGNDNPLQKAIDSEMQTRMQQAICNLPPRCRMIFRLIREDGLKYKDVAEILNISVNTIDNQMAIAVKKICEALQVSRPKK